MRKVIITEHFPISERPHFKLCDAITKEVLVIKAYKPECSISETWWSREHNLSEIKRYAELYEKSDGNERIDFIYITPDIIEELKPIK